MRGLLGLLALVLIQPASTQAPVELALYIGAVPNPTGLVTPVSKDFADSYADLKKAYIKAQVSGVVLVSDPAQADAILTVTYRGDRDNGTSVSTAVPLESQPTISSTQHATPTLLARLTVRATNQGGDFSGAGTGGNDRSKWSTQADRIYRQATVWLIANRDALIELRLQR